MSYLQLFIQNLLLELLVALPLLFSFPFGRAVLAVFLANALTHPWVVYFWTAIPSLPLLKGLLIAELFAILLEIGVYRWVLRASWGRCVLVSLLANLFSWQVGPYLSYFVGTLF